MEKIIKKSKPIILLSGIISFIIILILNIFYWDNELVNSLLNAGVLSLAVILIIQSINNYFYHKIILERKTISYIILKIVVLICIWKFIF